MNALWFASDVGSKDEKLHVSYCDQLVLLLQPQRTSASRPWCRSSELQPWFSPECPLRRCGRGAFATGANDRSPPFSGVTPASDAAPRPNGRSCVLRPLVRYTAESPLSADSVEKDPFAGQRIDG